MIQSRAMLALVLAALPFAACQKAPEPPPAAPSPAMTTPAPSAPPAAAELPNGAFTVVGVVAEVEDAGYPMFALTVLPDGQSETLGLLYNNEEASRPKDMEISAFKGQRAEIAYTRRPQLDLLDISADGKSLLKHQPGDPVVTPEATVTGKLSGADALTGGDLPDVITVTDAAGKAYAFEMFISDMPVVAANGKQVTVGYSNSQRVDATAIKLAPPKP